MVTASNVTCAHQISRGRYDAAVTIVCVSLLAIITCTYVYLLEQTRAGFLPALPDEVGYFANACSFAANRTLKDVFLFEELESPIGGFAGHGFGYTLLNGSFALLAGPHLFANVLSNFLLVLLSVALIRCQKNASAAQKSIMLVAILLYFYVPLYLGSYMQEIPQAAIAVAAGIVLYRVYTDDEKKYVRAYVTLMLLAAMLRPTWSVWLVGLVPRARNVRQSMTYLAVLFGGFIWSYLFYRYFSAYPYWFLTSTLKMGALAAMKALWQNVASNIGFFFVSEYRNVPVLFFSKYMIVLLITTFLVMGLLKRHRLLLAAGFIGLVNITLVLVAYQARQWSDLRFLAPVAILCFVVMAYERQYVLTAIVLCLLVVFFPSVILLSKEQISYRTLTAKRLDDDPGLAASFGSIATAITENKTCTILVGKSFFEFFQPHLVCLPLRGATGCTIRYTINQCTDSVVDRKKVHYAFYENPVTIPGYQCMLTNDYFFFYRVHKL